MQDAEALRWIRWKIRRIPHATHHNKLRMCAMYTCMMRLRDKRRWIIGVFYHYRVAWAGMRAFWSDLRSRCG
jgi:hypothetical protein